ncbi:heavy-metal-associated domain-containing protein [Salegentibacter sp. F188]|uniref:Heavy-metal-associated domain-containing protein n=1 Tax=Autumnicola patrickiae TaxID=3075591 RepID=A0ABU3E4U1_9FLAO|nr:heavy-metal-associated domain-containing protein [Salegentibacter sp. F188]MDT0690928.1 heavy-metal-associated domain-containing protein [Salegentibacter sp. F188]
MKTTITVQNLKCGGCVNTITTKLSEIENIQNVQVEKESSSVTFNYLEPEDAFKVKEKLRKLGYPAVDAKNSLASKAISVISCATGKM